MKSSNARKPYASKSMQFKQILGRFNKPVGTNRFIIAKKFVPLQPMTTPMANRTRYVVSIGKEAIAAMPVKTYPAGIRVIDTPEQAQEAITDLSHEKIVGFDTETRPSFRKGHLHKVALMQISTAECCYLFRLNKIGIDTVRPFLENPEVLKIGLSVHDDFNALRRSGNLEPGGFIDLQQVVKKFDISDISLQKIYAIIFGERISKSQRLSNWEADRLSDAQQAYAALDAWACLHIYNYLKQGEFDPVASPYRHIFVPDNPTGKHLPAANN